MLYPSSLLSVNTISSATVSEFRAPDVLLLFHAGSLTCLLAGVYALSSNDIRVGTNVEVDGAPWKVLGDKHFSLERFSSSD